ncbi:MAG: Fe2+-dependent dioxygenase [Gammaproteobacteria bacterium]|nr:Fe2+-dependent dioxygenase [Gammaproteobacteria bacterium]
MHLVIADILNKKELGFISRILDQGEFEDGRLTAGKVAARVKNNLQFKKTDDNRKHLNNTVIKALNGSDVFRSAVLPKRIHRPLFGRYESGMEYGYHVDAALMDKPNTLRTDVSVTVFLNDPGDYDGGELTIDSSLGEQKIKLPAGYAFAYPSSTLHRVAPVTRGVRLVAVTWAHSYIRDPAQREILFDLRRVCLGLTALHADSDEAGLANKTHTNLLRMWAES